MVGLEKNKLFRDLLTDELATLAQTASLKKFAAGETIFREGDPGDGLYVVLDGAVQLSALVTQEERRVLSVIHGGDFFGEMAVLDNEPRSATAVAEKDTFACFISRDGLMNVLERSPRLAVSLVREFSLRMRDFNRRYIQEVLQAERLTLVGRFARSIVHDFKNPLNIIGLSAEMASVETSTPESRQVAMQRVRKQVDRLTNMINELLEFTRGSQAPVVVDSVDYGQFVTGLFEEIRSELEDKHVELVCGELPSVQLLFDQKRLPHVFFNLIHNATDEMPKGGKIFLRVTVTPKEVITEIEDTGAGIAPEIAQKLFQPFATHGKAKGTGLGLSICKRIVEDHRGWIRAQSEAGRGAVFSFGLPLPTP